MDPDRDREFDDDRGGKDAKESRGRGGARRRMCRYCADREIKIDYKDVSSLRLYITDRGKLVPRRISGNCAKHQRDVVRAIKQARNIALVPFTVS